VRTRGDATMLAPSIRAAIQSVDRHQPIVRIATMDDLLTASAGERQFALILFQVFGGVALLLAGTGLYGVIANSVNERIREIGVRLALGSTRAGILDLIVRQGMAVTGSGIAIGLLAAAIASRGMVSLLFGVSQLDPLTYGSVVSLLIAVSLIACGIPAWRAARIDPSITLRSE
jgi:putative ABC transport system permease protein